eukprot:4464071-Amphidinium_carterae.1
MVLMSDPPRPKGDRYKQKSTRASMNVAVAILRLLSSSRALSRSIYFRLVWWRSFSNLVSWEAPPKEAWGTYSRVP